MSKQLGSFISTVLMTLAFSAPAFAQDDNQGEGAGNRRADTPRESADSDSDYGWIGLLGLAGLIGLMRRRDHAEHRDHAGTGRRG